MRFPLFCLLPAERDIKIVRPLYSVEVTETETAKFETEISEDDVHGTWKLKGEDLHQSAVGANQPCSALTVPAGRSVSRAQDSHCVCRMLR